MIKFYQNTKTLTQSIQKWIFKSAKEVVIPRELLEINYCRSQGPGGQNVNKVNSKAELKFHIDSQKKFIHLMVKLQQHVKQLVQNQTEREQQKNLELAIKKIQNMIFQASFIPKERLYEIPSETKNLEKRRIQGKRIKSDVKNTRRMKDF